MPPLSVIIKPVSGNCNMRCDYCFYRDELSYRKKDLAGGMTEETQEQVIRRILEFADRQCTILFQGGEPTLAGPDFYRKWLAYEKKYNKKNVRIEHAIQTNGYTLDEEWCRFFAENRFLVGLSIDGIPSTHDCFRKTRGGNETYFRVLDSARKLQDHRISFNVLTVVNRRTAPAIWKIYSKYRKMGFWWQQYIACLDPQGEEPGQQRYSLTPEMYGRFLIELFELWLVDLRNGCQPHIRQFDNYIGILKGIEPESCEQRGICSLQPVVESDGSVYPCDFYAMDGFCLGNLNYDSMNVIRESRKAIQFVEQSLDHDQKCRTCRYINICRGGCRRNRDGRAGGRNRFCESYRMFFDTCLSQMIEAARMSYC